MGIDEGKAKGGTEYEVNKQTYMFVTHLYAMIVLKGNTLKIKRMVIHALYILTYVHMYVHTYVCTYVWAHVQIYTNHVHTYAQTHIYMYACVHADIQTTRT